MFGKRLILAVVLAACWRTAAQVPSVVLPDRPDVVALDGHAVNATRILARLKPFGGSSKLADNPLAQATIAGLGLALHHEYTLVNGLIALDEPANQKKPNAVVVGTDAAARLRQRIQTLKDSGLFAYVEPDLVKQAYVSPTDQRFLDGTLWGLANKGQNGGLPGADINAVGAWGVTTGTNSVVVAVIDTGIRYTHLDLVANIWTNPGEVAGNGVDDDKDGYVDDIHGINAITGTGDPYDDFGHGTHVSGTIGAAANNGYPHVGVAWNVSLMGCKFLSAQGSGFDSDAIKCIEYAVLKKAKISNNSWGGQGDPSVEQALLDALNQARAAGHLFVCAAGNAASNNDSVFDSPSSFNLDNMISVAAIDRKDELADFSNYGVNTVHIGAPGVEIFSTWNSSDTAYQVEEGTSMACPHVVGVAALALAAHPQAGLYELRQRILNSSVPTPALRGKVSTGGRVNAYNAVIGTADGIIDTLVIDPANNSSLLVNGTNLFFVRVTDVVGITNATVTAVLNGAGLTNYTLSFTNNGKFPDAVANDAVYSAWTIFTNAGTVTAIFSASASNYVSASATNSYVIRSRPDNDSFAKPAKLPLDGSYFNDDNTLASLEPGEPTPGGLSTSDASLWYVWSASTSGQVLVDTLGSSIRTVLSVYTGSIVSQLTSVASVANTGTKANSQLVFTAVAGTTYHISVASADTKSRGPIRLHVIPGGELDLVAPVVSVNGSVNGLIVSSPTLSLNGTALDPGTTPSGVQTVQVQINQGVAVNAKGTTAWSTQSPLTLQVGQNSITVTAQDYAGNISTPIQLTVTYRPPPVVNDFFVAATALSGTSGLVTGDNTGATKEVGEPSIAGNDGGHSVWWSYTPPSTGILTLTTTNSNFDTLLGVFSGTTVGALTSLAANDDYYQGSGFSALTVAVTAGVRVYIAVDGFSGAQGKISLGYTFSPGAVLSLNVATQGNGSVTPGSGAYASNTLVSLQAMPAANSVFVEWLGASDPFANPLSFALNANTSLTAVFKPRQYSDDFETGGLSHLAWYTGGATPWFAETNVVDAGAYSVRSGLIADSQTSSLLLNAQTLGGIGSFDFKVSSEPGWDYLQFYVDGALIQQWSGEVDWSTFSFTLTAGAHQFEWRYSKDPSGSAGQDAAWLDNVQLLIKPPVDATSVAKLTLLNANSTQVRLRVDGQVNQTYVIQSSDALPKWNNLSTNANVTGGFVYTNSPGGSVNARFYRAVALP